MYLAHFSGGASHLIAHFKAGPLLQQAPQKLFPCSWKGVFPALRAPCHGRLPTGMWMEPSKATAGREQAGGERGEGRGHRKEIKNAKHAVNNRLPPELGIGCRQGSLAFFFFKKTTFKSPIYFVGEVQRAQQGIGDIWQGVCQCPVTHRAPELQTPRLQAPALERFAGRMRLRPSAACPETRAEQTKRSSDFRRLTLTPLPRRSNLMLEKRRGWS